MDVSVHVIPYQLEPVDADLVEAEEPDGVTHCGLHLYFAQDPRGRCGYECAECTARPLAIGGWRCLQTARLGRGVPRTGAMVLRHNQRPRIAPGP